MKALLACLTASALILPAVQAQDEPATPAAAAATQPATEPAAPVEVGTITSGETASDPAAEQPETVPATPTLDFAPGTEPAAPRMDPSLDLLPSTDDTQPQVLPEPILIPEAPEMTERPPGTALEQPKAPEKKSATEIASDELAQRIRYREVKTRAMGDPALQEIWRTAQNAKTDLEKRNGLKKYYRTLAERMRKIDKSLATRINERELFATRRLTQRNMEPTEPIDPAERTVRTRGDISFGDDL